MHVDIYNQHHIPNNFNLDGEERNMEGSNVALYLLKSLLFGGFRKRYCPDQLSHLLSSNFAAPNAQRTEAHSALPSKAALTPDDVKVVQDRIGMVGWSCSDDDDDQMDDDDEERLMDGLNELLEEKDASMEELKEAFYVFDRNEDGFISPAELWSVMRRLGLKEGARMEDCEAMIRTFDEDGDGRISFSEFKRLLEDAS